MDYIVNDEKVQVGDKILTSGEDHIFPKDLPIGKVESAKAAAPFQVISIDPAARLDRLEDVLVLLTQQELTPKKTDEPPAASGGNPAAANTPPPAHN
jgi:cell shape-determining protein MreC